jgi:hypothetical protein
MAQLPSRPKELASGTMSTPTDIGSVKFLLTEINSLGLLVLGENGNESARKRLISAAEKLIIAARTPGENLYLTAAQVGILSVCLVFLGLTRTQPYVNGSISAAYSIGCFDNIPCDTNDDMSAEDISLNAGAEKALVGIYFHSPVSIKQN